MVKDWFLEQKKGFWSMIKGWKDLEHDLELIEAKNMKILCKNIRHGRASKSFKEGHFPESLARPVPPVARPCAILSSPFAAFAFKTGTTHAKVSGCYLLCFWPKSPWISLWNILVIDFLGLKLVLGYK